MELAERFYYLMLELAERFYYLMCARQRAWASSARRRPAVAGGRFWNERDPRTASIAKFLSTLKPGNLDHIGAILA